MLNLNLRFGFVEILSYALNVAYVHHVVLCIPNIFVVTSNWRLLIK